MAISDDDLDACFSTDDFALAATFVIDPDDTPGSDLTVNAIFNPATDQTIMFGNVEIEAQKPSLICKTADIGDVRTKMTVTVDSVDYTVERIEHSGVGISTLYLKS